MSYGIQHSHALCAHKGVYNTDHSLCLGIALLRSHQQALLCIDQFGPDHQFHRSPNTFPIRTTFPASNCDPGPSVPLLQELNTLDKVHVYFARPPSILHSEGACLPAQRIGLDSPSNENTFRYRIRGVYLQTRNKANPKVPCLILQHSDCRYAKISQPTMALDEFLELNVGQHSATWQ